MLDKNEAPPIPDGYGISVAYACLLDVVHSISICMQKHEEAKENGDVKNNKNTESNEKEKNLQIQLVVSSWCGLLAALTPLVDSR